MKKVNIIGASTLAALEGNLVMTLLPNVLRRAFRWGSSAVGIACLTITAAAGAGETWDTFASGAGVNGPVRAMTTFDDDLIVGGQFGTAGGVAGTPGIARWDDVTGWSALGSGTQNSVLALTTFNGELIAGGLFTSASGVPGTSFVAKWNGSTWSPLGTGMNGAVYSLTTFDDDGAGPHATALYAGGAFTKASGTTVNYIAKWNGSAWSSVASGMNGAVYSLTTFDDDGAGPHATALYAGGAFTKVGNANGFNRIAKWNGSAWLKLGSGVDGNSIVFALTSFNGGLIVGGQFAMAGGVAGTPGIARWSGATWSALGSGLDNTVMSLATFDDLSGSGTELYVGGYFTAPLGGAANSAVQIARWNDVTGWSAVGSGMRPTQPGDSGPRAVFALAPSLAGDLLYAGGFCQVESVPLAPGYLMRYHFVP